MAKSRSEKILKALDKAWGSSDAVAEWEAARERVRELDRERAEVENEIREARESDLPDGVDVQGGFVLEARGRIRRPLEAWRRERQRQERATAVVEGRDPETFEDPVERVAELQERRDLLADAIGVAKEKAESLKPAANAAVRKALIPEYQKIVLGPAKVALEELGESAIANGRVRQELVRRGLSDATIPGITLDSYRTDRDGSRADPLIQKIDSYGD